MTLNRYNSDQQTSCQIKFLRQTRTSVIKSSFFLKISTAEWTFTIKQGHSKS